MQRFELLGRNGAGANSTVYRCRDNESGTVVAVKKMEGATITQILHEAAFMRICAYKHCVQLLEAYQGSASGVVYLVMENVEHSLARELLLNHRGLPINKAKLIAFQLAQALELVHSKQIAHGDIKPANILLTSHDSVKLCDFGSATTPLLSPDPAAAGATTGTTCPSSPSPAAPGSSWVTAASGLLPASAPASAPATAAASRWYCAPESLLGMQGSTAASDIWALGCVLGELMVGKPLMPGSDEDLHQLGCVVAMIGRLSSAQERVVAMLPWEQRDKLEEARARGPLLDRVPKIAACPALLDTLRACLHPDPAQRPTAQQLLAMPFFADVRQALQADEEAAAAAAAAAAVATIISCGGREASGPSAESPPLLLNRRTSSGNMDVDGPAGRGSGAASSSPDPAAPSPLADQATATGGGGGAGGTGVGGTAAAPPARRVSGVQAAAPVRPVPRSRVSALTATIRGNPFDADGGYVDLMPQVLRLVACWQERATRAVEEQGLGPIALSARRGSSALCGASLASSLSCELMAPGAGVAKECYPWTPTLAAAAGGGGVDAVAMPAAPALPAMMPPICATPIAAAAGGCGATRPPASATPSPAAAAPAGCAGADSPAATAAAASPSPMDCTPPATPGTQALPTPPAPAAREPAPAAPAPAAAPAARPSLPLSASVGAVSFIAKASGLASTSCKPTAAACIGVGVATAATAAASCKPPGIPANSSNGCTTAGAGATTAATAAASQLRSRVIINRARRHHNHTRSVGSDAAFSGSVPSSFLTFSPSSGLGARGASASGGGLGSSATLLQRELAAAAAAPQTLSHAAAGRLLPMPCGLAAARATSSAHAHTAAGRRSTADLFDLASVAEYAPLERCDSPPDSKRRRGLAAHGLHASRASASASAASLGSLVTEAEAFLGCSLPDREQRPALLAHAVASAAAAAAMGGGRGGGHRMRRSSSGGSGLFAASGWHGGPASNPPQQHWQAGVGSRPISLPQPISARSRYAAATAAGRGNGGVGGMTASVSSDVLNSAVSDVLLRSEVA